MKRTLEIAVLVLVAVAILAFARKPVSSLGGEADVTFFTIASSSKSVTTSSTSIFAKNAGRVYGYCVNNSTNDVYLSLGGVASKQWGVTLHTSASYQFEKSRNLYLGAVTAITQAGTARLSCLEATYQ